MRTSYRIGPFRLDAASGMLFRGSEPLALGQRAVEVLRVLVERAGVLVTKGELIEAAWSGLAVDDSNLTVQIAALRRMLGEEPGGELWIETLPRRGYRFVGPAESTRDVPEGKAASSRDEPALRDRPSIAVMPFQNLSDGPDSEYFADGVVEDIITILSRLRSLRVIARSSSFAYKSREVTLKQVVEELGVRYVLEGSVRRAGAEVRLTTSLVDAATGVHLWADRFDGKLERIFDLQDEIAIGVVGRIAPAMEQAEIARARREPTTSLDAYDCYLRAMASFYRWTRESNAEALGYFQEATRRDPEYGAAYGMAGRCYTSRKANGWRADVRAEAAEMARMGRCAVEFGSGDAIALCTGGFTLAHAGDLDESVDCMDRALSLNPSLAWAWYHSGWVRAWRGETEIAIAQLMQAIRLSPIDPLKFSFHGGIAFAHLIAGRYDEACKWAERSAREQPNFRVAVRILAASRVLAGRLDEARATIAQLLKQDPSHSLADLRDSAPFRRQDLTILEDALREAGLSD